MIGKGHEELEISYLGDIELASPPKAPVVLEAEGLRKARRLPGHQPHREGRRDSRRLRLHGLRPDRARPHAVRQAPQRPGVAQDRWQGRAACATPRRPPTPASPMCRRAGAACCSTTSPSTRTSRSPFSSACRSCGSSPMPNASIARKHIERLSIKTPGAEA